MEKDAKQSIWGAGEAPLRHSLGNQERGADIKKEEAEENEAKRRGGAPGGIAVTAGIN